MERPNEVLGEKASASERRRWTTLAIGLPAVLLIGGAVAGRTQESAGETIDLTRASLEQYIDLRKLISAETVALQDDLDFLSDEIDLVTAQIEARKEEIKELNSGIEDSADKVLELEEEEGALRAATATLEEVIPDLEARTKELLKRVPAPAYEITSIARQQIPEDPETTKEGLARRFGAVAGVLTLLDKFNTDIHAESEIRTLQSGQDALVTVLYLGLSLAYYVNDDGTAAGRGTPSA
ncbi:MAG: DUF3450 family protein, partial [Planctomycetota bacterium]